MPATGLPAVISPLIRLFIREPELLASHLGAYLELGRRDLRRFRQHVRRRSMLLGLAAAGVLIGSMLAGVAALLWAARHETHWVFFAVPLVPLALGLACALGLSRRAPAHAPLERIWNELESDLNVLGRIDDAHAADHAPHTAQPTDAGDAPRGEPRAHTPHDDAFAEDPKG